MCWCGKQKRGRAGRGMRAGIAAVLLLVVFLTGVRTLYAVFDEKTAVHINPDDIEEGTWIIGTHLIYLGAMNEELYQIAVTSASDSGQGKTYYKSELSDGAWYQIDGASSIRDIKDEEKMVNKSTIADLFFTHHTKSDGRTYDLRTNQVVEMYDIISPYDLEGLPELQSLVNAYDSMDAGIGGTDKLANLPLLEEFFGIETESAATELYDEALRQLSQYKMQLKESGDSGTINSQLEILDKISQKLDAGRRYLVCQKAAVQLEQLADKLSGVNGGTELLEAVTECQTEVANSQESYGGNRMKLSGADEESGNGSGEGSGSGNGSGNGSGSGNSSGSSEGSDPDATGETQEVSIMTQVEEELLQAVIEAIRGQDDAGCRQALLSLACLYNIMDGISVMLEEEAAFLEEVLIPRAQKAYEENPVDIRKGELDFYEKAREQLLSQDDPADEQLRQLCSQKELLKEQYLSALDKEELTEAVRLEAEMAELDKEIAKLGGEVDTTQNIQDKKARALQIIEDGDAEELSELTVQVEAIGALIEVFPELSGAALKELYEKMAALKYMEDTSQFDELLSSMEKMMAEHLPELTGKKDGEEAMEIIKDTADSAMDGTDPAKDAGALAGLVMYSEQTNSAELAALAADKAEALSQDEGSRVFQKNNQSALRGGVYAPVDKVAAAAGFRYVWNSNQKQAILAAGSRFYSFYAFSDKVEREKGAEEETGENVLFQTVLYLPAEYVQQQFGLEVYEMPDSAYAVLMDKEARDQAAEVCDALLTK